MAKFSVRMGQHYRRRLEYPIVTVAVIFGLCVTAFLQLPKLEFDASADTLIAKMILNSPTIIMSLPLFPSARF